MFHPQMLYLQVNGEVKGRLILSLAVLFFFN